MAVANGDEDLGATSMRLMAAEPLSRPHVEMPDVLLLLLMGAWMQPCWTPSPQPVDGRPSSLRVGLTGRAGDV